eukprot:4442030-Amphidinium_carterae.1
MLKGTQRFKSHGRHFTCSEESQGTFEVKQVVGTFLTDQEVLRLQVAMEVAMLVHVVHRLCELSMQQHG